VNLGVLHELVVVEAQRVPAAGFEPHGRGLIGALVDVVGLGDEVAVEVQLEGIHGVHAEGVGATVGARKPIQRTPKSSSCMSARGAFSHQWKSTVASVRVNSAWGLAGIAPTMMPEIG
jgi:hypothetical protein